MLVLDDGLQSRQIEPDLAGSTNTPPTPRFDAMLAEYARLAADRGRLRVQLAQLPALISGTPGWDVVRVSARQVEHEPETVVAALLAGTPGLAPRRRARHLARRVQLHQELAA